MFHKQTVEPLLLSTLQNLLKLPALSNIVLVGGTVLTLQIGNRKSIDIDFNVEIQYIEKQLSWEQISFRLIEMVRNPNKVFNIAF